ncbi:ABC transporter ATP-binding protein [Mollicutes bacterium LVI A0039]|nr:ABC transporter ATP-binding protein [Mollicutes bacterium LVI A0039]
MVKLNNVKFGYKPNDLVIEDVTYEFLKGNIYGVAGKNGAGKSTLFDLIASKIVANAGQIEVDGVDAKNMSYIENPIIVLNNEKIFYKDLTVYEHFKLLKIYKRDLDITRKLEEFNLVSYADNLPSELSLGTAQRLNIALKSVNSLNIILADEPFNGLDPIEVERLKAFFTDLRNQGSLIIVSSHDIHNLEQLCDKMLILKDGMLTEVSLDGNEGEIHERI